jgi:type I restriction enzyme S subunit
MEGQELPVGWVEVPIGDLCELRNGRAFKPAEWTDEGIPIVRIQNLNNWQAKFNHYQGEVDANHLLGGGELLFAWSGTPGTSFGAHIWAGGKAALNQHIFRVDFDEDSLQKGFFRYAINQKLNDLIDIAHGGVGLRHVTKGKFEQTEVFLPPLNEQRRIAAKLDTTLAAVEACRQRLDRVAAILKRFRQAVLAAAAAGELTREWREERGLGHEPFKRLNLKDLVQEPLRNGKSVRDGEGDYVLRLSCLKSDSVDWSESKRGDWDGIDVDRFLICQGDFLVARGNGSKALVGRACLVNEPPPRMAFPDTMIRIRPNQEKIHPVYLSIAWEHHSTRDQIEGSARTSAGIWKVAQSDLEVIRLPIPDQYEEQVEVVRRAQQLFTLADQLEARLTAARKVVDRLTPALLAKAFRGELVPQDPSDEPAIVLLERIRAARQADAGAGKPSRRGRPKAAANPDQLPLDAAPVSADFLAGLLRECGALSERALLAVSELEPKRFQQQLYRELESGTAREVQNNGQVLLEAVG